MTMYQFIVNAFCMLCGVTFVATCVVIAYIVLNVLFRVLRRGGGNNGSYDDEAIAKELNRKNEEE